MITDAMFAVRGVTLALLALHVTVCGMLIWASRRAWSGIVGVFQGLLFQLPLLILTLGSAAIAGDAMLEHDGKPVLALALAPLALVTWWFSRRDKAAGAGATVGLRALPSLALRQALKVLFSGVAVLAGIEAIALSALWCLVLAHAVFDAAPLTLAGVWALSWKAFVTVLPALVAAAAVSVFIAILAFAVTMTRKRS